MLKENKKKLYLKAAFFAAFLLMAFSPNKISPRLQEKLENAVRTTFEIEDFELETLPVGGKNNSNTNVELGAGNLFKITQGDELLGYAYLGEAPSMKDVFDYVVLFNTDLSIKKSKVLIYRENHGRQIGSQRWLKQFIGKKAGDSLSYGEDIDAISGATISAKSMTKAVGKVLKQMEVLKAKQVI